MKILIVKTSTGDRHFRMADGTETERAVRFATETVLAPDSAVPYEHQESVARAVESGNPSALLATLEMSGAVETADVESVSPFDCGVADVMAAVGVAIATQKDHVCAVLDRAEDAQDISAALSALDLLAPVWRASGHSASETAVLERAVTKCGTLSVECSEMLATARLKPTERRTWMRDRDNLLALLRGLNRRLGR